MSVFDGQSLDGLFGGEMSTAPGPSPLGPRPERSVEVAAAKDALRILGQLELSHGQSAGRTREIHVEMLIRPELISLKPALRVYPPVRVRCENGHSLDWMALAPFNDHGLQLVHGPRLRERAYRKGGALDITSGQGGRAAIGTAHWVNDGEAEKGNLRSRPDGEYGAVYGLKAAITCKRCRPPTEAAYLHITFLRMWLEAVISGERTVSLGGKNYGRQVRSSRAFPAGQRDGIPSWTSRPNAPPGS